MNEVINRIESDEFVGRLGLSSKSSLLEAINSIWDACHELMPFVAEFRDALDVEFRALELLHMRIDRSHKHPCDVAIAVYIILLHRAAFDVTSLVLEAYDNEHLFWARRISKHIEPHLA